MYKVLFNSQLQNKKAVDFNFISIILLILLNDKTLINGQGSRSTQPEYNSAAVKATTNAGGGEIINPKSLSLNEPSCEELRAMWRFSKVGNFFLFSSV